MRLSAALFFFLLATSSALAGQAVAAKVSVSFMSSEQCEGRSVTKIDRAQSFTCVQAYSSSDRIVQAACAVL